MLGKLTPLVGNFLALRVKPEQAQNRPSLIARVLTQLEEKACEWAKPPVSTQASAAAKQREAQLLLREQRIASMSPGQAIIEIIESGSMRDMENLIARSPEILSDSKSITLKCLRPSPGFRKRGDLVQVILDEIAAREEQSQHPALLDTIIEERTLKLAERAVKSGFTCADPEQSLKLLDSLKGSATKQFLMGAIRRVDNSHGVPAPHSSLVSSPST